MRKIPTTIITGFLGAGKSTLVRHLMEHNHGRRIALIVTDHDHDDFESFAIPLPEITDPETLADRLRQAITDHDILRLKGFLAIKGKAARQVVQAVGARLETYYDRPWKSGEERKGHVVVIGRKGLDRRSIAAAVTE